MDASGPAVTASGGRSAPPRARLHVLLLLMVALFTLTLTGVAVLFVERIARQTGERVHATVVARTQSIAEGLARQFAKRRQEAAALARLPATVRFFEKPGPETLAAVNRHLDLMRGSFGAEVCYLLSERGVAVASSNRGEPDSFVGQDYSFRPYFARARAGEGGFSAAVGVTSGRRGLYFAHPVSAPGRDRPLGVAVAKYSAEPMAGVIPAVDFGLVLLVDENEVVFAGSDPVFDLTSLRRDAGERLSVLGQSRRYGDDSPRWSGLEIDGDWATRGVDRRRFRLHRVPISSLPGWWVVALHDTAHAQKPLRDELTSLRNSVGFLAVLAALTMIGVLFVAARREVLSRESAERKLRTAEQRLRMIASSAADAFISTDGRGRIVFWSPSAEALFGYSEKEAAGMDVERLLPPEVRGPFRRGLEQLEPPVEGLVLGYPVEYRGLKRDGEEFPAEVSVMGWLDEGRQHFTAVVRDFTERKRERDRLERVSEELRSALAEVRTLSGLLPICASCKRIRDDSGAWSPVEVYVRDRTEAEFSHGLCPRCQGSFFPGRDEGERDPGGG